MERMKLKISTANYADFIEVVDGGRAVEITFTPADRDLWRDRIEIFLLDSMGAYLDDKAVIITKRNKLK